jgi:CHAD domain-containing protein
VAETLWRLRARSLMKGRKAFREGDAEGLHDLRVALRRIGATAAALGEKKIERRSRSLVRSFSQLRQLEIDRQLLGRVRALSLLRDDAASSLDARWDGFAAAGVKKAVRVAEGKKMRRLLARLRRRARRERDDVVTRLDLARRRVEGRLAPPPDDGSDRELHRYRIAIKRARYLAEDLTACGFGGLEGVIAREKELQDALGRWNDVRLFRERLSQTRVEAEQRGAVTLALELDRLIAALEGTVASARLDALALAGRFAHVLAFGRGAGHANGRESSRSGINLDPPDLKTQPEAG